jgi:hypothetical protein
MIKKKLEAGTYTIKLERPVSVFSMLDSNGEIYHIRELPEGTNDISVNIVKSDNYTSNCDYFISNKEPLKSGGNDIEFADVERFRLKPIKVVRNPYLQGTPARIFTMRNPALIEVGNKFYGYPKQVRWFILLHEFGHLFYKTEWKVDKFALWAFLQMGYNKSQAFYALSKTLTNSEQSTDRIKRLFDSLNVSS